MTQLLVTVLRSKESHHIVFRQLLPNKNETNNKHNNIVSYKSIHVSFCLYECYNMYNYVCISADPGLCQGRGGAWDHRRCGTSLSPRGHTSMASSGSLKQSLGMLHLQPTGTPRPHIHGFFWASKPAVCQPLNPPNAPNP